MKSVYAKILIWCFGTLLVSLVAFGFISTFVLFHIEGRGGIMPRIDAMVLHEASAAYETGGPSKLAAYLNSVHSFIQGQRYLTDSAGKDLVTGEDRSELLASIKSEWGIPHRSAGHTVVGQASSDGRFRLIGVLDPPVGRWSLAPYYLMVLAAVGLLCWALAASIASPLRAMARTVERFGRGDLSVRTNSRRNDEIGEVARAFDLMAERIGTLLAAERRLLQDVSHELRAPLARMTFAAELIRTASDREAAVVRLKKEIDRLSNLVGILLQMTRAEGDPDASHRERVSLKELLDEVIEDCWMEADARGCQIVFNRCGDLTTIGDGDLLRRAIENIVLNAIRFTRKGSAVELDLGRSKGGATIRVRDYGPGVPAEALPKLFQPFFRVDDSRDSATGGMGLGLAIARRAIGLHHGRVWAENAVPGLTVSIELPMIT